MNLGGVKKKALELKEIDQDCCLLPCESELRPAFLARPNVSERENHDGENLGGLSVLRSTSSSFALVVGLKASTHQRFIKSASERRRRFDSTRLDM